MGHQKEVLEEGECAVEIHAHEGRHFPEKHLNLVRSRWTKSYRDANLEAKLMWAPAYYNYYDAKIRTVLMRPDTTVRLAVLADDADNILGFSVIEGKILHYVEVKNAYRRNGIGGVLVPEDIEYFSHLTKIGAQIWSVKAPNIKFIPFT